MSHKQREVEKLFLKKYSAYDIHMITDIPIKEVYHYVKLSENAKRRYKEATEEHRKQDALAS